MTSAKNFKSQMEEIQQAAFELIVDTLKKDNMISNYIVKNFKYF